MSFWKQAWIPGSSSGRRHRWWSVSGRWRCRVWHDTRWRQLFLDFKLKRLKFISSNNGIGFVHLARRKLDYESGIWRLPYSIRSSCLFQEKGQNSVSWCRRWVNLRRQLHHQIQQIRKFHLARVYKPCFTSIWLAPNYDWKSMNKKKPILSADFSITALCGSRDLLSETYFEHYGFWCIYLPFDRVLVGRIGSKSAIGWLAWIYSV